MSLVRAAGRSRSCGAQALDFGDAVNYSRLIRGVRQKGRLSLDGFDEFLLLSIFVAGPDS